MIYFIIGTKAQLIKMAPIMREMDKQEVNYIYISTGQHKKTMGDIRENFGIRSPDLSLYAGNDITNIPSMIVWTLGILRKAIFQSSAIFPNEDGKDLVLIHGDTFSTLIGALIGRLAGKHVGHIESGLRSYNIFQPFPEELIRIITFKLSNFLFCPGSWATKNVAKEKATIINTGGNTLYDAIQAFLAERCSNDNSETSSRYAVASIHRFENITSRKRMSLLLKILARLGEEMSILFVLHLPTIERIKKLGLYEELKGIKNITLEPRMSYFKFIQYLASSELIITDGGSNQEEAFYLGKPTLIFRDATERKEGIGKNALVSNYSEERIYHFFSDYKKYRCETHHILESPSKRIVNSIKQLTQTDLEI